jgi:hypothetical protein
MKISTRYLGPTDTKGARISVRDTGDSGFDKRRLLLPFDHEASDAHDAAFLTYCRSAGISGEFVKIESDDGRGWDYISLNAPWYKRIIVK